MSLHPRRLIHRELAQTLYLQGSPYGECMNYIGTGCTVQSTVWHVQAGRQADFGCAEAATTQQSNEANQRNIAADPSSTTRAKSPISNINAIFYFGI